MNFSSSFRRSLLLGLVLLITAGVIWKITLRAPVSPAGATLPTSLPAIAQTNSPTSAQAPSGQRDAARAAATSAQVTASAATPPAVPLWARPENVAGTRLPTGFTPNASGHNATGRTGYLAPALMMALDRLTAGEAVELPLFDGESVSGRVNLVQADAGNWTRIGGTLTGEPSGTFSLSSNGSDVGGAILLPDEGIAFEITRENDGRVSLVEKPIGDVVCAPMPSVSTAQASNALTSATTPARAAATIVPILSSRPTATAVIYMDFDGETVTDPRWNGGQTIVAAPANLTPAEISQVWAMVSEDYSPFAIDVTTDVNRYNNAPVGRRMRCIVTPTSTAAPGSGGVAYINCFSRAGGVFSSTIPCWVFNGGVRGAADSISHEVGHTFGLHHDGRTGEDYYTGHGSGAVGWSPIMGAAFYRELSQWSKGEYPNASQTEDDIAIISSAQNGFGFVPDQAGGARNVAAPLGLSGTAINQAGTISTASDDDFYVFTAGVGSSVNLTANPAPISPNLDLLIELQDSNGAILASANPDLSVGAAFSAFITAGTYYVRVKGTGRGSVSGDGYSDYGSIGAYTLTGTITGAVQPPTLSTIANQPSAAGAVLPAISFTVSDPDTNVNALTLSGTSSNQSLLPNGAISFGGSGSSRSITLVPVAGQSGTSTVMVTVSDGGLTASTSFSYTVTAASGAPVFTTQPQSQTVSVGAAAGFTTAANGTPSPTFQWFKNGTAIAGANGTSLTIGGASASDAGSYTVVASNSAGSITSAVATLTVNAVASGGPKLSGTPIGSAPWHGLASADKNAAFDGNTATSFDSEVGFIYVGLDLGTAKTIERVRYFPRGGLASRMNGGRIRGANAADLSDAVTLYTISSSPPEGVWQDVALPVSTTLYRFVFFTTDASGYGNVAELEFYGATTVTPPVAPKITGQPQSAAVNAGSPASFTVSTDATTPLYQWFKNGSAIGGATGSTFTIAATTPSDAGSYTVTITSPGGSVTSSGASLTVTPLAPTVARLTGSPIGSAPWHGVASGDKNAAFDGNTATAFDSEAAFIYVGLDLASPKTVERVRYFPRGGLASRMNGGRFRGANAADLSDAVTLHTIAFDPPDGVWQDVSLPASSASYRYLFFTTGASGYGNVAELEFFGGSAGTPPPSPPQITGQPQSVTVSAGNSAAFSVTTDVTSPTYQWFKNAVALGGATGATFQIATTTPGDAGSYTVVVSSPGGSVTSSAAILTVTPVAPVSTRLAGTPIGSAPWHGLTANDKNAAFDGNTATAFDSEVGFIYVGLDLGIRKTLDRVRYFPRGSLAFRMNGGRIRGANAADLSDAVTLHTITSNPPEGTWQDVTLPVSGGSYRYVFFTTDAAGYGNVAELEFYGITPAAVFETNGAAAASRPQTRRGALAAIESLTLSGWVTTRQGIQVSFTVPEGHAGEFVIRGLGAALEKVGQKNPARAVQLEVWREGAVVATHPANEFAGHAVLSPMLSAGRYTIGLRGQDDVGGMSVLEISSLRGSVPLERVSFEGWTERGERALTAGFAIDGDKTTTLTIRGTSGSEHLSLTLYRGAERVNDGETADLPAGVYTIQARGDSPGGRATIDLIQKPRP